MSLHKASSMDNHGGTTEVTAAPTGFFRTEQVDGRWWIITPDGHGFFSLGLNHAEETDLKYPYNQDIWAERYGSRSTWIQQGPVRDLSSYGFNTLGWTQQWVAGDHEIDADWMNRIDLRHSQGWTADELRSARLPFVQTLRFAEIENWNGNPGFPDVFSRDFQEYCDHLARRICGEHRDDARLIGYFFVDIPSWLPHASGRNFPGLEGLSPAEYDRRLSDIARKYYEVTTASVRKVDPNHLILGDRYNGNKGIPAAVLQAATPHIDVLSVQYFPGSTDEALARMHDDLAGWAETTGKPVILADVGNSAPTPLHARRWDGLADQTERADNYIKAFDAVIDEPWLTGWHWCGYVENPVRGWGLKDHLDEPYHELVEPITAYNRAVHERITRATGQALSGKDARHA
ncbi:hypothetical protein ACWEQN_31895 [Streptomyces sp. NPDC004129]